MKIHKWKDWEANDNFLCNILKKGYSILTSRTNGNHDWKKVTCKKCLKLRKLNE